MKNKILAGLTVLSLLLVAVIGINGNSDAYAVVSIDINPSFSLLVDEDGNIVKVEKLNDDAENYQDELVGLPVTDAIDLIIAWAEENEYLNEGNNDILISSAKLDGDYQKDLSELIEDHIKDTFETSSLKLIYVESDEETAEQAQEEHTSLGKLEITKRVEESIDEDDDVLFEALDLDEDDDDLYDSVQVFLSRLSVVDPSEQSDDYQYLFASFKTTYAINFEAEGFGILENHPDLQEILKEAQILWKAVHKDYQQDWVAAFGDDDEDELEEPEEIDEDLYESTMEFLSKLKVGYEGELSKDELNREFLEDVDDFLDQYALGFSLENYGLDQENMNLLQIKNEAKALWQRVQKEYQTQWAWSNDEDDFDMEDMEDLTELIAKLRMVADSEATDDTALIDFLSKFDEDNQILASTEESPQALKAQAKEFFFLYKDDFKGQWDDDEDDDDEIFSEGDMKDLLEWVVFLYDVQDEISEGTDEDLDEFLENFNLVDGSVVIDSDDDLDELKADAKEFFFMYRENGKDKNDSEERDHMDMDDDDDDDHDDDDHDDDDDDDDDDDEKKNRRNRND